MVKYMYSQRKMLRTIMSEEALPQEFSLDEISEAFNQGVSTIQYPKLRRVGISHEVILEVNGWFNELELFMPTRTELFKALIALTERGFSHYELKPFVGVEEQERLKGLNHLIRHVAKLSECLSVVLYGQCSAIVYARLYKKAHGQI